MPLHSAGEGFPPGEPLFGRGALPGVEPAVEGVRSLVSGGADHDVAAVSVGFQSHADVRHPVDSGRHDSEDRVDVFSGHVSADGAAVLPHSDEYGGLVEAVEHGGHGLDCGTRLFHAVEVSDGPAFGRKGDRFHESYDNGLKAGSRAKADAGTRRNFTPRLRRPFWSRRSPRRPPRP